jgi:hypothetical protein
MPVNGTTLPIIFDFYNCNPINDIMINLTFPDQYGTLIKTDDTISIPKLVNSVSSVPAADGTSS